MATPPTETSPSELWDTEYRRGGIPSSVRGEPSRVLVDFLDSEFGRNLSGRALDIGCGAGRNAWHLAELGFETTGFDYSQSQVAALQARVEAAGLPRLRVVRQDVSQPWPLPSRSIDFATDTFCFKHQIHRAAIDNYVAELDRCLAPRGKFLLFFATRRDGYYRRFPDAEQFGPGLIITDPGNGIRSRLYDLDEMIGVFSELLPLRHIIKSGLNTMHGAPYERESGVIYFEKP